MSEFEILRRVIRAYRNAADPAGLGKLLFEVEKAVSKSGDYIDPKRGADKAVFGMLFTAFAIMEDCETETGAE